MNYYTRHTIIEAIEQKLAYLKALDGTLSAIEAIDEPDRREELAGPCGRELFRAKLQTFASEIRNATKLAGDN